MERNHQPLGFPNRGGIQTGQQPISPRKGKLHSLPLIRQGLGSAKGVAKGLKVRAKPGDALAKGCKLQSLQERLTHQLMLEGYP
jgi:hypothetical protein